MGDLEQLVEELGVDEYTRERFEADRTRLIARLCAKHAIEESEIASLIREHRYTHSAEDPEDEYMQVIAMGCAAGWLETIKAAAIRTGGVVYIVPRPGRHHNVLKAMPVHVAEASHLDEQGFITSTNRFVDRREAAKIARAAIQLIREPTPSWMLTSEDVW
jgi:hypothetical protein